MRYAAVVIFCAGYFNNISRTYFSVGHGRRRRQAPCTAFNAPDAPTPAPSPTWPVVRTQNIPQIQGTQNYHRLGRSTDALCGSEGSSFQRCKIQYLTIVLENCTPVFDSIREQHDPMMNRTKNSEKRSCISLDVGLHFCFSIPNFVMYFKE